MISKTSLFNKGIYRSNVKRFVWGGVLYFVLLFVMTGFILLMSVDVKDVSYDMAHNSGVSLLYQQPFILPSLVTAIGVATVVALLIFRFVHSKRQSIFAHSLPVCRTANFISSLAAAFTLMFVPLILNTLILVILSVTRYAAFFTVGSCFGWMGMNMLCLFIMFSVAVFAAMLTGNSFAAVALNGLMHCFLIIIAAGFGQLSDMFLYGYAGDNPIYLFLKEKNFFTVIFGMTSGLPKITNVGDIAFCAVLSVALYIGAYVLYRLRRMETVEDVAAFKCLNPIFKYLVTFIAAISTFSLASEMLEKTPLLVILLTLIVSVVAYIAVEMTLKKTLRVWRSYKGYLIFAALFGLTLCTFAFTNFFGFETRVPNVSDISEAALYNEIYFNKDAQPFIKDGELISYFADTHKRLSEKRALINKRFSSDTGFDTEVGIEYKLKNGKTLKRKYGVAWKDNVEIMDVAYANLDYKKLADEFFTDKIDRLGRVTIRFQGDSVPDSEMVSDITDVNKFRELFETVKSDIATLNFSQMYNTNNCYGFSLDFQYTRKQSAEDEKKENVQPAATIRYYDGENYYDLCREINPNYKNTIKWLYDNGYGDLIRYNSNAVYYIEKDAQSANRRHEIDVARDYQSTETEYSADKFAKIDPSDVGALIDFAYANVENVDDDKPVYFIYAIGNPENGDITAQAQRNGYLNSLICVSAEQLPDFLAKYVNK